MIHRSFLPALLCVLSTLGLPLFASADQAQVLGQELFQQLSFFSTGGALPQTVGAKMAPLISAGGASVANWLRGDTLGNYLYGSQAQQILHGTGTGSFVDASNRQGDVVDCASIPRDKLAVILAAGQSNGANSIAPDSGGNDYQPHDRFYNLNIGDGRCYVARSPSLGIADIGTPDHPGVGWSYVTALGDDLIDSGLYKNVLVVPINVSGTYIEQWQPSGNNLFRRFTTAVDDLRAIGLSPTFVLWHQGEGNAGEFTNSDTPDGTPISMTPQLEVAGMLSYMRNFFNIVSSLRGMGITAPIFVARATICGGSQNDIIRSAQTSLADPTWGIYPGPDTDTAITRDLRDPSDCHMTYAGGIKHAQLWATTIQQYLSGTLPLQPSCTLSLNPTTLLAGQSVTLAYTTANAQHLEVSGVGGSGASAGQASFAPATTTTYIGTVTSSNGLTNSCFASIVVQPAQPPPTIGASNTDDPVQGSPVKFTGSGFGNQATILLNDQSIGVLKTDSGSQIVFQIPASTTPGSYAAQVKTTAGTSNAWTLRVHAATSAPVLASTNTNDTVPNGSVTVRGTGLTDWNFVYFDDGTRLGPYASPDDTSVTFTVPSPFPSGTYHYYVASYDGQSNSFLLNITQQSALVRPAALLAGAFAPFLGAVWALFGML